MDWLRRFSRDERGSVVPMFALAIVPVIGFMGAAIDYSRAGSIRTQVQVALDATALMASKTAATQSATDLQSSAQAFFNAQFSNSELKNVQVTASYTGTSGSELTVSASGLMDTRFMSFIGQSTMSIGSTATVRWGNTKLRVALALDNTGSMASANKMTALKTATKQLLTTLQNAATNPGDVQVAIIPFAKDVNVGASNYNASWLDWTAWNAANGSVGCQAGWWKIGSWCWTGTTFVQASWVPANKNTWTGCITDRTQPYDTQNTTPTTVTPATLFVPEQYTNCPVAMMGQSYSWSQLNALVDSMTPDGNTNTAIGMQVAWQALTDGAPFNPPPITDPHTQKIIILFTDGLNTQNRWTSTQSEIDARQQITCTNAKAAGVTIYTVQVNTATDPISTMLQNCATDTSKFFFLTTSTQIVTTFNQIGVDLAKLRISK